MSTASLLLPLTAASESHVQAAAPTARLTATASVNFKIVIPKVLSLQMSDGSLVAGRADSDHHEQWPQCLVERHLSALPNRVLMPAATSS
jgi:hypothetical protein